MTTLHKITAMTALTMAMIVAGQASASFSTAVPHQMLPAASYQVADGGDGGDAGLFGATGIFGDGMDGDGGAGGNG